MELLIEVGGQFAAYVLVFGAILAARALGGAR